MEPVPSVGGKPPVEVEHPSVFFKAPFRWAAGIVAALLVGMLLVYPLWGAWPQNAVPAQLLLDQSQTIDLNKADFDALCALPGIGEKKAQAILAYREAHGSFETLEELLNVPGIGEKTLQKLKNKVTLG